MFDCILPTLVIQRSCSQSPQFHAEGIHHSLITCHEKCKNFCGDYVEKYVTIQFSLDKCYSEKKFLSKWIFSRYSYCMIDLHSHTNSATFIMYIHQQHHKLKKCRLHNLKIQRSLLGCVSTGSYWHFGGAQFAIYQSTQSVLQPNGCENLKFHRLHTLSGVIRQHGIIWILHIMAHYYRPWT